MANISHHAPGYLSTSRKIRITDACLANTSTNFEILQPANSVIELKGVYIHTVGTVTVDSAEDITFNLGTDTDYTGGQVVASAVYLEGSSNTSVLAGTFKQCATVDGVVVDPVATYGNPASVTTTARTLYGRFVTGDAVVSGGNEVEVHVSFRQL